jgi:23S rRNA (guanosine2251-2'-O)-methyltransferase
MRLELVYGIHVVRSLLQTAPERILEISLAEERDDKRILEIKQLAKDYGIAVHPISKKQLAALEEGTVHQGVLAKVRMKAALDENDLKDLIEKSKRPVLLLILDQIQDPHNLGACLRTADATGVDAVIIPRARSVSLTPVVRKIASGAAETVACIEVSNLARCLEELKQLGVWIFGASGEAMQSLFKSDLTVPLALVLGAEGKGLRHLTAESCDILIQIPMVGSIESLNVSVAAGVCLYEAFRQRQNA